MSRIFSYLLLPRSVFMGLMSVTVSLSGISYAESMDDKVREAVVAELARKQQQAYDEALSDIQDQQVRDDPQAQQSQLQQLLKFTVAKAVNEYGQEAEQQADQATGISSAEKPANRLEAQTQVIMSGVIRADRVLAEKQKELPAVSDQTKPIKAEEAVLASTDETAVAEKKAETVDEITVAEKKAETVVPLTQSVPISEKQVDTTVSVAQSVSTPDNLDTKVAPATKPVPLPTPIASVNDKDGVKWVYLGRYTDGAWVEKTLHIGDALPLEGQQYKISQAVNVRDGLPEKDKMPNVVDFLGENAQITLVKLKKSGKNGYYWGQIIQ